jgi:predicted amidophosphoribosyltransferase
MGSFRCYGCKEDWPPTREFVLCPRCGLHTGSNNGPQTITNDDAFDLLPSAERLIMQKHLTED